MITLPYPSETHQPIHRYSYPLGGAKWLEAEYHKVTDGYRWMFALGGEMKADMWPEVLGRGLAGVNRFGHHTPHRYSVGRHSLLMAAYLWEKGYSPAARILACMHDAPETLGVGDMNTHLKRQIGSAVRSYEDDLLCFILDGLGVVPTEQDEKVVHFTDKLFGAAEARLMNMQNGQEWSISDDAEVYKYLLSDGIYDRSEWTTEQDWHYQFNRAMGELNTPKGNTNAAEVPASEPSRS